MSDTQPAGLVPAKPLTAIELGEKQLGEFRVQYDQTLKQLHMIDGAIQGTNIMLTKLRAEAAKAAADATQQAVSPEADKPSNVVEFPAAPPQAS